MPAQKYDPREMVGKTYRKLFVIRVSRKRSKEGRLMIDCRCKCGREFTTRPDRVASGKTKKCVECKHMQFFSHGMSYTSEYRSWAGMCMRCTNRNEVGYSLYGARGISVCKRWLGRGGFARFIADIGPKPSPEYTIERKNVNGNYTPKNCRWATKTEQTRNKRNTLWITIDNMTICGAVVAQMLGINPSLVSKWAARGLSGDGMRARAEVKHLGVYRVVGKPERGIGLLK